MAKLKGVHIVTATGVSGDLTPAFHVYHHSKRASGEVVAEPLVTVWDADHADAAVVARAVLSALGRDLNRTTKKGAA